MKQKPLKILIGNNSLALLAGSETWAYTLATQLKRMGHEVYCFAPELGIISKNLEDNGIKCFDKITTSGAGQFSFVLEENIKHDYDVIIANHNNVVDFLRSKFKTKPIISTIHGIIHTTEDEDGNTIMAPEHPALNAGVNDFVSVSEEVQEMLKKEYNIGSSIIRNFIDIKKFTEKRKISKKPKQILFNSNYHSKNDPEVEIIRAVAKHYGAKLTAIGQNFSPTFDTKKAIQDADIVFGVGRSVLEGMSSGRIGIVHGRWGTGGVVNSGNVDELKKYNFSGRNSINPIDANEIIKEIDVYYNENNVKWGRDYIVKNHNSVMAAEMYVLLARELLGQTIVKQDDVPLMPYRRAKDVVSK